MRQGAGIQYLTQAGLVFLTLLFTAFLYFYIMSPVVDAFFGVFTGLQVGHATDEVAFYVPLLHTAIKIVLALSVAIPMVWFIFWCLHREPKTRQVRFY